MLLQTDSYKRFFFGSRVTFYASKLHWIKGAFYKNGWNVLLSCYHCKWRIYIEIDKASWRQIQNLKSCWLSVWIASHWCVIMTNSMAFEFHSKPSACPVPAVENLLIFHRPTSVEVQTFENEVYLVGLRSWYDWVDQSLKITPRHGRWGICVSCSNDMA